MPKIAWSPSQQTENSYSGVATTEKIEMEKLSLLCEKYHNAKGGESIRFSYPGDKFEGRPLSANALGAEVYVALHSDSGGGTGTTTFSYPGSPNSFKLGGIINANLTAYFRKNGIESNRSVPNTTADLYETRLPASFDMQHTYIEVNFHDNVTIAKFMTQNWDSIAKIIVDSIWQFKGWVPKIVTPEPVKDTTAADYHWYRVCTTSHKSRNAAYKEVERLKGLGIPAFVAYVNTPTKK